MTTPTVLIHVQHLLGIGHLKRALAVAAALAERGVRVVAASGGEPVPLVEDAAATSGVEIVRLPAARAADESFSAVLDANGKPINDEWKANRRAALLQLFETMQPDAVITEMYPFGRRPFRFELQPLLEAAQARAVRPVIACSVRDVLVTKQKPGRAEEMAATARSYYDLVLVHGDPALIPFATTFPAASAIADLIRHTGYVTDAPAAAGNEDGTQDRTLGEVLVSAGGGAVGFALLAAAIEARSLSQLRQRNWRIIAGANLPESQFMALAARMMGTDGIVLERFRPDFRNLLARCRVSVSQGGYNTVLEILASRTPAVIVPFATGGEDEQTTRAQRLAEKGLLAVLPERDLSPERLAMAIDRMAENPPPAVAIAFDGAAQSARLVLDAIAARATVR